MTNHHRRVLFIAIAGTVVSLATADAKAPAGRFVVGVDSGDIHGTTFPVVYDRKTKLTWQQAVNPPVATRYDAEAVCIFMTANESSTIGWRLPTTKELLTLIDYAGDENPQFGLVDATYFPNTPNAVFWASTSSPSAPSQCVDFTEGWVFCSDLNYVRCVH
jgi:hypothetical protein